MKNSEQAAFGHSVPGSDKHGWMPEHIPGLTKREYFVGLAMQGLVANTSWAETIKEDDWDEYLDRLSTGSVEIADRTLEKLEKQ